MAPWLTRQQERRAQVGITGSHPLPRPDPLWLRLPLGADPEERAFLSWGPGGGAVAQENTRPGGPPPRPRGQRRRRPGLLGEFLPSLWFLLPEAKAPPQLVWPCRQRHCPHTGPALSLSWWRGALSCPHSGRRRTVAGIFCGSAPPPGRGVARPGAWPWCWRGRPAGSARPLWVLYLNRLGVGNTTSTKPNPGLRHTGTGHTHATGAASERLAGRTVLLRLGLARGAGCGVC